MKRFTVLITVLFVVSLFSVAALACDKAESASATGDVSATAAADTKGNCPLTTAEAGQDADAAQAKSAACKVQESVLAEMPACCATAVAAGEGCHGKDAAALNAEYAAMVTETTAELAVLDSMHECCAEAVQVSKGCCGKDAAALQTKYDTEVKAKTTEVASSGAK